MKQLRASANPARFHLNRTAPPRTVGSAALAPSPASPLIGESVAIATVIVTAERLIGEALRVLLLRERGIDIIGEAAEWRGAVEIIRTTKPDVVLLDPAVPDVDHAEAIGLVKRQSPRSRVLLLLASRDASAICRAVKAGANGYVSKSASLADVAKAIRGVYQGEIWVERKLFSDIVVDLTTDANHTVETNDRRLTRREREILRVLTSGGTNRHIADALFISEKTVKTHLNNIFRKLNVTRRLQAVLYAVGHGLRDH